MIEEDVEEILREYPTARGDDDWLYIIYCDCYLHVALRSMTAREFLRTYRKKGIPTLESIGRYRRAVQSRCPELRASKKTKLARKKCEKNFLEFARSVDNKIKV